MIELQTKLETPLIKALVDDTRFPDAKLQWPETTVDISKLRDSEKEITALNDPDLSEDDIYIAVYDLSSTVKLQAGLGIATTFLVCIVLGSGAAFFSKLTTDLVISPIEDMVTRVNNITNDPLKAAHEEEERLLFEEMAEKDGVAALEKEGKEGKDPKEGPLETAMLEKTLSKIGALLALGFGEAGSKIIAQNMA